MLFDESDIDFAHVDSVQFEELCFDLLVRLGFQELQWRRAAADSGRDLEGKCPIQIPLVGTCQETWAIECKHYNRGVPAEALSSKLSWAEAERPDRLLILVSSHLTNNARTWLQKRQSQVASRIHVVEGKALKQMLLGYGDLVERYFGDRYTKLLRQAFESWVLHGLMPSLDTLELLVRELSPAKLTAGECGFLWCVCLFKDSEIRKWEEDHKTAFPSTPLLKTVSSLSGADVSVLEPYGQLVVNGVKISRTGFGQKEEIRERSLACELLVDRDDGPRVALYGFDVLSNGEGVEVLVWGSSRPEAEIRHWPSGGHNAIEVAERLLDERHRETRSRRNQAKGAS